MADRRKVLIVDDELDICSSIKAMLERKGCDVFVALKSEDAWEIFQRECPQACVIDIHLPYSEYDGIELLRKIRAVDQKVFCLMFTCVEEKDRGDQAKQLGANKYCEKPASAEDMEMIIKLLAGNK